MSRAPPARAHRSEHTRAAPAAAGGFRPPERAAAQDRSAGTKAPRINTGKERSVVIILAKAGLRVGHQGLVDAYDRGITTTITTPHLADMRPDIVHQCLLAIFDSDLAASGRVQVYILTTRGTTIEINPSLRPPRTYARFKGLMEKLLNEGRVTSTDGAWLMRTVRGSIAPYIPYGADVTGIHNAESTPVHSAITLARAAVADPVPDTLQGGVKNAYAFYCISCTDDSNLDGLDFVTTTACLSRYPTTPHVAAARILEGFRAATSSSSSAAAAAAKPAVPAAVPAAAPTSPKQSPKATPRLSAAKPPSPKAAPAAAPAVAASATVKPTPAAAAAPKAAPRASARAAVAPEPAVPAKKSRKAASFSAASAAKIEAARNPKPEAPSAGFKRSRA